MNFIRRKFISVVFSLFCLTSVASAAEPFKAYLFAYFTGNSRSEEAIRFALSDDAHTFKALNQNKPIISSSEISETGGVRDPHILRGENNDFYMVVTDMVSANGWSSNRGLVLLRSENLIDWESSAINIPKAFSKYSAADRVWAPQVIFDPDAGKYMVYFAMRLGSNDRDKLYYAYADSTFTKLESAPELLYKYGNNSAIDGDIVYHDSTWHLFFKTEGTGNGIKKATSKKLTEEYELYDKYLQLTNDAVEGSCVFKLINSDTWVLMYDVYGKGRYEFALSTDLKNFTKDPVVPSFDFHPRHGTIIPITENEKWRVLAKWNPTDVQKTAPAVQRRSISCRITKTALEFSLDNVITGASVSLINLSGKEMVRRNLHGSSARIQLSAMPSGVYFVVVKKSSEVSLFRKIILR